MNLATSQRSDYCRRSLRDNLAFAGWTFAWMASFVIADKAALYGWWTAEWISWVFIAVNAALGVWLIFMFLRMLRGMDELQRKIHFDALGIGLGVTMVGCITYSLLVTWGYIADEDVSDIFVLMCASYSAACMYGVWKYR